MSRRNRNNGLDLSGVGGRRLNVGGGSRSRRGLSFAGGSNIGSGSSSKGFGASGQMGGSLFSNNGSDRSQRKRLILIIVGVILALALAFGVGFVVYKQTVKNALKPDIDPAITAVLSQADQESGLTWSLLVIEKSEVPEEQGGYLECAALIAADSKDQKLTFVWLPTNLRIYVAGYGYKTVDETYGMGDQASFIQACSDAVGVPINHFFAGSTDGMDVYAEQIELGSGLSNESFAVVVMKKLLGSSTAQLETMETYIASDMDESALSELVAPFKGIDVAQSVFNESIPLDESQTKDGYVQIKTDEWATIEKRISSGLDPVAGEDEINESKVIRSGTRVTIWNGVGVSGIASDCSDFLKEKGWEIESTGNAASFVYEETLIVYNYDADKPVAELLVSDLGQGRVVRSAARYSFAGDVLLVIGKDYQPY